jgi:uncharacterized protein (DUF4415 family)
MPRLSRQTPKQRELTAYMMEVMERLEWDLHNTIELTGRIPEEWHAIAARPPELPGEKVTLRLDRDVVKFFRSMGVGYGGRINDVLRSYMQARLVGLLRGAETTDHFRRREARFAQGKPAFSEDVDTRPKQERLRSTMQEHLQGKYAEDGLPEGEDPGQWIR